MRPPAVIVGAGVAGLAAGLRLARGGRRVLILEAAPRLEEVGAGVQLSPNATRCLHALGALDAVAAAACAPEEILVRQASSRKTLLRSRLGAFAEERWGAPYLQVLRADLQAALLEALAREPRAELGLGVRVVGVRGGPGFETPSVETETGDLIPAEVVLGCDGLRSKIREVLFGPSAARFTGQLAWRGLAPRSALPTGEPPCGVLTGPTRHFVYYPVRRGERVNFIAVAAAAEPGAESWSRAADAADLLRRFADFGAVPGSLIGAADGLGLWPLYDRPPLAAWSRGAVGLLGDAAHPMLPFLAQGAAMALEDALAAGACLLGAEDPAAGLRRLCARRRDRTTRVQSASRLNARLFHLPDPAAALAFRAAGLQDRLRPQGQRFDWLYGYDALADAPNGSSVGAPPCE